jgi:mannitol-1-phosphate/altronate dehydrogenase
MSHILHNTRPDTHIHHDEDEKPKAIQIGAGNIGRGFIAPILSGAGYTVVFADIDKVRLY